MKNTSFYMVELLNRVHGQISYINDLAFVHSI